MAALAAIGQVTGIWPWHSHGHYPSAITSAISKGAHGWFSVHTPFDPAHAGAVDHDVRLVYFVLAVGLSWLLVARRWTVPAIAVAFFGFAMPSTVASIPAGGLRAAIFLGLALFCLRVQARPAAGEEGAGSGQAVAVGMAMVAIAFVVAALPGVTKPAFLDWHSWNPLAKTQPQLSVSYVWNQSYQPLHWPKQQTTVFFVWSPQPHYWPVARLETFRDGSWRDTARPADAPARRSARFPCPTEQLPSRAYGATAGQGLHDHPRTGRCAARPAPGGRRPAGDVVAADRHKDGRGDRQQRRGQHRPGPGDELQHARLRGHPTFKQLEQAGTHFPGVDRQRPGDRPAAAAAPTRRPTPARLKVSPWLVRASNQVWHLSNADLADNEWDATAAVESYLRSKPFKYSQTTVYTGAEPVLAQFLLTKHSGYCQMYSGAMALVLRLHGIPARVVVGFTTGLQSPQGPYVVTDHDAHSWVETYFPGWGWQEFDPTPTRHLPSGASMSDPTTRQAVRVRRHGKPPATPGAKGSLSKIFKNHLPKTPGGTGRTRTAD